MRKLVGDAALDDAEDPDRALRGRRAAEGTRADPNQQRGRSAAQVLLAVKPPTSRAWAAAPSAGGPLTEASETPETAGTRANALRHLVQRRQVEFGAEAANFG